MVLQRQQVQGLALTHPSNEASSPQCHQKPRGCASPAGVQSDRAKIKVVIEIIF